MSQNVITSRYQPFAAPAPSAPSHERVFAIAATLALNMGALIVLTLPMSATSTHTPLPGKPIEVVDIRPIMPPPLVTPPVRRESAPPPTAAPRTTTPTIPAPAVEPIERGAVPTLLPLQPSLPATSGAPAGNEGSAATAGAGADAAGLQYIQAPPPRYPREALRQGLQGTVWLRVLVDEAGRPVEVSVEQGSGHRVLDEAARRQVLAQWLFQPALRDGRAVPAWGRVPIDFRL